MKTLELIKYLLYLKFRNASLIQSGNSAQFEVWMLNRICTAIIRELKK
jgi:hypothetical protein